MRLPWLIVLYNAILAVASPAPPTWKHGDIVPGEYIVTYHRHTGISARNHDDLLHSLHGRGVNATLGRRHDAPVFHGAELYLPDWDVDDKTVHQGHVDHVRSQPQVQSIEPVRILVLDTLDTGEGPVRAARRRSEPGPSAGRYASTPVFEPMASTNETSSVHRKRNRESHEKTGVASLHKKGYRGKGMVVVVIDSGVDYLHPDLGGGYGPGYRIAHGKDFVGNTYNPDHSKLRPNPTPMDCVGHGTQMMGILAAQNPVMGLTGVVPEASFGMMRIWDCNSRSDLRLLIAALVEAATLSPNVISLSIQVGGDDEHDSAVLSQIMETLKANIQVVMAVGNSDGDGALFDIMSAAAYPGVVSVASAEPDTVLTVTQSSAWQDGTPKSEKLFAYWPVFETAVFLEEEGWYKVVPPLDNGEVTVCDPTYKFPRGSAGPGGYIVLMVPFQPCVHGSEVQLRIREEGFSNVMYIVNKDMDPRDWYKTSSRKKLAFEAYIDQDTFATFPSNKNFWVWLDESRPDRPGLALHPIPTRQPGWTLTDYSTIGPSVDGHFSPMISGPGNRILTTSMGKKGSYASTHGTSSAAAYVAGCAALLAQALPGLGTDDYLNRLVTTASWIRMAPGSQDSSIEPTIRQGGGLVNVERALGDGVSAIHVTPTVLELGDAQEPNLEPALTVCNKADKATRLGITVHPARTVYWLDEQLNPIHNRTADDTTGATPSMHVRLDGTTSGEVLGSDDASQIVPDEVEPGGCRTLRVLVRPDQPVDGELKAERIPIYSGFLSIQGHGTSVQLPYMGMAGDRKSAPVIDMQATRLRVYMGPEYDAEDAKDAEDLLFKLPPRGTAPDWELHTLPAVKLYLGRVTPLLGLYVVPADYQYTPGKHLAALQSSKVYTIHRLKGLSPGPIRAYEFFWGGIAHAQDNRKIQAQPGSYRIAVAAEEEAADPAKNEDPPIWVSEPFEIVFWSAEELAEDESSDASGYITDTDSDSSDYY